MSEIEASQQAHRLPGSRLQLQQDLWLFVVVPDVVVAGAVVQAVGGVIVYARSKPEIARLDQVALVAADAHFRLLALLAPAAAVGSTVVVGAGVNHL